MPNPDRPDSDKIIIGDLNCRAIIGLNSDERDKAQDVVLNIVLFVDVREAAHRDDGTAMLSYSAVAKAAVQYTQMAQHRTLEALATGLARLCVMDFGAPGATVRAAKPAAITAARYAAVEVTRTAADFSDKE